MPDDPSRRGGQDRERIDVGQEHEVRHWTKKFGVTAERLKEAVKAVGDRADKVMEHLRERGDRKPAKRAGNEER